MKSVESAHQKSSASTTKVGTPNTIGDGRIGVRAQRRFDVRIGKALAIDAELSRQLLPGVSAGPRGSPRVPMMGQVREENGPTVDLELRAQRLELVKSEIRVRRSEMEVPIRLTHGTLAPPK